MLHDREYSDTKQSIEEQERRLNEHWTEKLAGRVEEERIAAKEELKRLVRLLQERQNSQLDDLYREHKRLLQRAQEEHDREMDRHRLALKEKTEKYRAWAHDEMKQLQQQSQQRLTDLKLNHSKYIETSQLEHEEKVS